MTIFLTNYEAMVRARGLSPSTAAIDIGFSKGAYTKWRNGGIPSAPSMKKIADYFGVTPDWLMTDHTEAPTYQNAVPAETPADESKLPVYGSISAGRGVLAVEDIIGWAYADEEYHDGNHFWLSVSGVSMEPELRNGDLVLIRKQPQLDNGNIGAFIYGGEGFVKKYIANGDIRLHSLNPVFPDIVITPETADQFSVIGKVIEARHKY